MKKIVLESFSNTVALLQLSQVGDMKRLKVYFSQIPAYSIVVIGEYVLDLFFSEINNAAKGVITNDSNKKIALLSDISKEFSIYIVAPIITGNKDKIYKKIALITPNKNYFYAQQCLINFSHWDEASFYDNSTSSLKTPLVFEANGFKFALLFGYELHFDELTLKLKNADIDAILLPSANTFGSESRWKELIKVRSFLNSCYIFRVNKVGSVKYSDGHIWEFYGNTLAALGGEIINELGDKEGMLCIDLDSKTLREVKNEWSFKKESLTK
ncbi:carbon-nitrogen hydrolase family protein [Helicobacter sp. 11S02629-2]|uniref:carbon-nitrogen hydrolase family protein n=1 Tax=Helicobacter sp. 11S02629-2 TaxID=1476195 RepID=UPI000BA4EC7F|nr:carbon-nitrogen hydrolase family protein [Helicobacter sp. 11S02629-2]PAF45277.1 hypothetical protein BKH40_03510 [Helicobacter sp. 11S02629-2]